MVYDIAAVPPVDLATFHLRLHGAVAQPADLFWAAISVLPHERVVRDFHCVTAWSVRSVAWEGVLTSELIKLARPGADVRWVLARGARRLHDERSVRWLLASGQSGGGAHGRRDLATRARLPASTRDFLPVRLEEREVPCIEFRRAVSRGFWEDRGYHDRGDPWLEERFHEGGS